MKSLPIFNVKVNKLGKNLLISLQVEAIVQAMQQEKIAYKRFWIVAIVKQIQYQRYSNGVMNCLLGEKISKLKQIINLIMIRGFNRDLVFGEK